MEGVAMTELRWVTYAGGQRVLEYRVLLYYLGADGSPIIGFEPQWSDWIRVPQIDKGNGGQR